EPEQEGEIRFTLRRAGQLGIVEMGWHTPEAKHPDSVALDVMDQILSAGVTSRLYQALVEKQLAISASTHAYQFLDPGLFTLSVMLRPGVTHEDAEVASLREIRKLKTELVSERELQRAKNIILSQMIYLRDSPFGVVSALAEAEAVADWKFYADLPKNIEAVTADDIQLVAQKYFTTDNRTVGWFIPKES